MLTDGNLNVTWLTASRGHDTAGLLRSPPLADAYREQNSAGTLFIREDSRNSRTNISWVPEFQIGGGRASA